MVEAVITMDTSVLLTCSNECSPIQPSEQRTPAKEHAEQHEAIQYYTLEGLFPLTQVLALNVALGTFIHLAQHEEVPYPLVLGEQQVTERERDLLRPCWTPTRSLSPMRSSMPAYARAMSTSLRSAFGRHRRS